jgi:membrane-bound lytic murein transglycosylase B
MAKPKIMFSVMLISFFAINSIGCSSNHIVNKPVIAKTKTNDSKSSFRANNKKSQLSRAQLLAKKKAWNQKRRDQQLAKKKSWIKLRRQQLANKKKRLLAQHKKDNIKRATYSNHQSKIPSVRKTSWQTNRRYSLTGDFANNSSTHQFVQHMSRSYGMDSSYLNRLFSQARDLNLVYTPPRKNNGRRYGRTGSWTRYRKYFITPRHINGGVNFWRKHADVLNRTYQQYGVPPEYIVGILGVETIYGGNVGKTRVLDSLSTKAFHQGRRKKFFLNELEKFLLMTRSEGLNPTTLMGSSAGAIGLCQFMPSNFKSLGVDYNRNGVCNLWDPVDAIGSVANYFSKHGWRRGGPVAVRALVTGGGHKKYSSSYKRKHSLSRLSKKGIRPQGRMDSTVRFLRMSTYSGDEVWLGGHNFYVITRYNHSSKYALAVHQLAQEIKRRYGNGDMRVASR